MKKLIKAERMKRHGGQGTAYFWFAAVGVLIMMIIMIWAVSRPASPLTASERVPPYFPSPEAAQPFPTLLSAADFSKNPAAQRAYTVAAHIPGVLAQQPCYCHCDLMGHRSLLDCYASEHAAECASCLMEAMFGWQMTRKGQDPATIRQEIIRGAWRNVRLTETSPQPSQGGAGADEPRQSVRRQPHASQGARHCELTRSFPLGGWPCRAPQ